MSQPYRTALDYLKTIGGPGGLWSLAETVGDAFDLSGNGNDGTVTYAEGQRGVLPSLYDRGLAGMRLEEGTTNETLNPRAVGTYTGTVPCPPNWAQPGRFGSVLPMLTYTDGGEGPDEGAHYVDIQFEGNSAGNQAIVYLRPSVTSGVAVSAGEVWTASVGIAHVDGTLPPTAGVQIQTLFWRANGTFLSSNSSPNLRASVTSELQRFSRTFTIPADAAFAAHTVTVNPIPDGSDFTLRIYLPQLEEKPYATSPVHGDLGTGYAWTGTEDASPSTRVATSVNLGSGDDLDNIFDGGGAVAGIARITSDGEGDAGTLASKGWSLKTVDESGGLCRLQLTVPFSGTDGVWRTARTVPVGSDVAWCVRYDADATTNDPIVSIGVAGVASTPTITETQTPVGTRTTDASIDLVVGNVPDSDETADAVLSPVAVWQGTQPTEGQIARFFRLALAAELIPLAPARVYLHDGSFRRIGQLTTAVSVNRSYRMDRPGQASVTIAVDDPLIGETSPLAGRVLVVESAAYPVPWVGKIVRRRGNRRGGTVSLEAESFDAILEERVLPAGFATTGSAGAEMARVLATVNGRNPTGVGIGNVQNHIVPIAGMSFPEWTARRALDAIGAQSGLEWWLDYEVATENIEILFRAARSRGFNRYRSTTLVDGGNCTWEDWTEEGKATTFALTVVAGQTSVTESYTERTRTTQIVESGGGFVTTFEQVAAGGGGQTSTPGGNTGSQSIEYGGGAHGFVTVAQTVRTPITRRERSVVREELKTRDVTVQSAQALLRQRRLSEQVITVTHLDASGWGDLELGSVVRLVAPGAFADGFDGPARILGVQPMEELGECDLVLELLHDPEAA